LEGEARDSNVKGNSGDGEGRVVFEDRLKDVNANISWP
jgi:hypothetical protein